MKYVIIVIVLIFGYVFWLDYGCELGGYMTWHGKKCVQETLPATNGDIKFPDEPVYTCTVEDCKG